MTIARSLGLLLFLAQATLGQQSDLPREQDLSALEGKQPPALLVQGWLNTDGPLTFEQLTGKVVLIDFWGTW